MEATSNLNITIIIYATYLTGKQLTQKNCLIFKILEKQLFLPVTLNRELKYILLTCSIILRDAHLNFNSSLGDEPNGQPELAVITAAPWCIAVQSACISRYLGCNPSMS